ncbi:MAG: hypothetical protein MJ219_00730 [Mycoplasmoidaceae bacterium]|nr:hypothetical protein [Mycoplasmoidaceae bacterium]
MVFGVCVALAIMCGIYGLFHINGVEDIDSSLYKFLGCQTCDIGNNLKPYF